MNIPIKHKDEEYRPVQEFPLYMVSNYGNVWSMKNKRFVAQVDGYKGYKAVNFNNGQGWHGKRRVHLLVCEIFNGPYTGPRKAEVEFIDGNRDNMYYKNLQWLVKRVVRKKRRVAESNRLKTIAIEKMRRVFPRDTDEADLWWAFLKHVIRCIDPKVTPKERLWAEEIDEIFALLGIERDYTVRVLKESGLIHFVNYP